MVLIIGGTSAAQAVPPVVGGNGHSPAPDITAEDVRGAKAATYQELLGLLKDHPELTVLFKDLAVPNNRHERRKQRKVRYSRQRYDDTIADLINTPRSVDLILDELAKQHPIRTLPRDLGLRVQKARVAQRAIALGMTMVEMAQWMDRLAPRV